MKCTFWGVRGSISAPGNQTAGYGGNTSCIELRSEKGDLFILDAGTGLRKLGLHLMETGQPLHANLLLTHAHWDHIEGIPFFKPFYFKKNHINLYGSPSSKYKTKDVLRHALTQPFFPIGLNDLKADIDIIDITSDTLKINTMRIDILLVNHPSRTIAYKFNENNKTLIYMTDNELFCPTNVVMKYEKIVDFCADADVLIHDAMYTQDQWTNYKGWGHSSIPNAVQLGLDANVVNLFLFHHDPERTDKQVETVLKECRQMVKKAKKDCHVEAAAEGQRFSIK